MAQPPLHGIIGSAAARRRRRGDGRWLIIGSLLPDVDFPLEWLAFPFGPQRAARLHRTGTHSLLMQAAFVAGWVVGSATAKVRDLRPRDDPESDLRPHDALVAAGAEGRDLFVGMALHSLTDVLLWFSPVALAWPLGRLGLPETVDVWRGWQAPARLDNLLGAADDALWAVWLAGADEPSSPAVLASAAAFMLEVLPAWRWPADHYRLFHYGLVVPLLLPLQFTALQRSLGSGASRMGSQRMA